MLLILHDDKGKILDILPGAQVMNGDVYQFGRRVIHELRSEWAYYPDQGTDHLYIEDPEGTRLLAGTLGGLIPYTIKEKAALLDRDTGKAIDKAVHPQCGDTETLGILRDQLVMWGNKLGLEFSEDFTRLNEIAIAAVEGGATKKAAITNA